MAISGSGISCDAGDLGLVPGLGRSPGEGNDNPFQYSCWENPMDRSLVDYMGLQSFNHDLVTEHSLNVLEKL